MIATLSSSPLIDAATSLHPEIAIVLGSGMGMLADRIRVSSSIPFVEVPGLAAPTVENHQGMITFGHWAGKSVLVFEGRLHLYEGHPWRSVEMPAHIASLLGVRCLLLTNAAGGIHDSLQPGAFMAIRDHVEWNRLYCWRHPGPGALGAERLSPYSPRLLDLMSQAARGLGIDLHQGIYAAVTGPSYETPAEIRALKTWGADAVGMSTTREALKAKEAGLECAGLSCITNRAAGLGTGPIHHAEVLSTALAHGEMLTGLIEEFLRLI